MVLFSRGARNHQRGLKCLAVVCIFLSLVFGRIHTLAWSFHGTDIKSMSMAGRCDDRGKRQLNVRRRNNDDDFERHHAADYEYAFVHPSIRNILVMEPPEIDPIVLEWKSTNAKNCSNTGIVDEGSLTIRWDILDKFLRHERTKTKTQECQSTVSFEQLVLLASQCDAALFNRDNQQALSKIPSPARGLLRMLPEESRINSQELIDEDDSAHTLVATLLALNIVENSIRHLIGKKNGKAPLLKDMIEMMASRESENSLPNSAVSVLRTLLLPTNGLNLRNLVWHGFLPTIPRKWLSLSIVLTLSLDELAGSSSFETASFDENPKPIADMRNHERLVKVLDHGIRILESPMTLDLLEKSMGKSNVIPKSHRELFKVSLQYVHHPIIFASVMGPFIEHLLRLLWCRENNLDKQVARPGSYYVTLDGHGQKDKHEVVVMPFVSQQGGAEEVRNKLVYRLGGSTMAFLMDMFTSPSGGPNIRATVAHGSFNDYLVKELVAMEGGTGCIGMNTDEFKGITSALLVILSVLCEDGQDRTNDTDTAEISNTRSILRSYQPCFSYSASLLSEIGNMMNAMESLNGLIRNGHHMKYVRTVSQQNQKQVDIAQKIALMSPGFEAVAGLQKEIRLRFGKSDDEFTDENFFQESLNNAIVSECGAAKLLLSEIAEAASFSFQDINGGISALPREQGELSSRRRKQVARICASAQLTLDFYLFAAYCALLFIERRQDTANTSESADFRGEMENVPKDDELFVAVKRSRMVVSTFSTTKTFDRALSALSQYVAGKAVKAVSQSLCNSSI